jgi:DNA-binding XRE family transcriptional regulator
VSPFTEKIQKVKFKIIINNPEPLPLSTIGEQIRVERLKLGWTGYELAEHLGVSGMTIYNWENGGKVYKLKHRRLVSYFLGV